MSLDENDRASPRLVPEDRPLDELYQSDDELTPARRAALAALEREFRDLLGAQS